MKPTLKAALLILCVGIAAALFRLVRPTPPQEPPVKVHQAAVETPSGAASPGAAPAANLLEAPGWMFYFMNGADATKEDLGVSESQLTSGGNAVRFRIAKPGHQIFDIHYIYHFNDVAFAKGDTVTLRFKARSPSKNLVSLQMQQFVPPAYPACWTKFISLTPEWKTYEYTFTTEAYPPKEAALVFKLGQSAGVIDLADLSLERAAPK